MMKTKIFSGLLILILVFFLFFDGCKRIIVPDEQETVYVVKTIDKRPIKTFSENMIHIKDYDCPLEIKLIDYHRDSQFEGSVKLSRLEWRKIKKYEDYTGNPKNTFYVDTKGKLGPVEKIIFYDLEIIGKNMKGKYVNAGPLIDTTYLEFTAEANIF